MEQFGMATSKFSQIEKHPLRDCYMLYSRMFPSIPPIFGTLDECERAQVHFEIKANEVFNNLPITDKEWVINRL